MKIRQILALPLMLLAAGCYESPLSTAIDLDFYAEYSTDNSLRIGYGIWNRGNAGVHLAACDHAPLFTTQRHMSNDTWQDVSPASCPQGAASAEPIVMNPGGSWRGAIAVSETGEYRLAVIVVDPETGAVYRRVETEPVIVRR